MKPTRILHLIDDLNLGGAEQVMATLVESLPKQRYYPLVCSLENGSVASQLRKKGIELIILPKHQPYDLIFLLKLVRLIKKMKIGLIHSHLLRANIYGWLASRLCGIPMVITIHGKSLMNWKYGTSAFPFVLRHSEKVITVSEDLKDVVAKRFAIPLDNFVTIYNGIGLSKFSNRIQNLSLKECFTSDTSSPIVGSVGGLRPVKDYHCLLKCIPIVLKELPKTKFVIVGDGPLRKDLEDLSKELGIQNSVIFLGWRTDILELLAIFDIFALSSKTEGISISILEAMASGLPVITTGVCGNPEVVEDGKTGFLVSQGDFRDLAEAIIRLLENTELREAMGRNGRKKVEEKFSLETFVDKHIQVYDGLIDHESQ